MPSVPTSEALRRVLRAQRDQIHVAIPGIVRSYDASRQVADVEPAVRALAAGEDAEDQADVLEALPTLLDVPVCWPGGGAFFLHAPIAPGDAVLLVFCESEIGAWRATGEVSHPGLNSRHGLSGAIAIPLVRPAARPINHPVGFNRLFLGHEGGPVLSVSAANVDCGGASALALAAVVDAVVNAIVGATIVPGDGGASIKAAVAAAWSGLGSTSATTITRGA